MQNPANSPAPRGHVARVGITVLIVAFFIILFLALWKSAQILLLAFAGILLAVVLRTAANAISRWTRLRPNWALTLVLVLSFSVGGATIWIAGPQVTSQIQALSENLDTSVDTVWNQITRLPGGQEVADRASNMGQEMSNGTSVWQRIGGIFTTALGAISGLLVFFVIGIFLAYDPQLYLNGILRLVPMKKRERSCQVLESVGQTLQGWLVGQMISMAFLFATTWIMLALLGVPLSFILALLTGILTFVPYIGPIISIIPILLVSFIESPQLALYTGLLYLVIQNVESNVLMPIVFQKTASLSPALSIVGQLILGGIFGILGVILATPITAVLQVFIQKLYVEDILGDSMDDQEVTQSPELGKSFDKPT